MTAFRYFRDPHGSRNSSWQPEPSTCGLCKRERPGYTGPFYGREKIEFVCEECLAGGRLGERGEQEVGQAELTALAGDGDGDGASFFRAHVYHAEDADLDWDFVPPAAPEAGEAYSVGVYLFRCVECDRPVLLWDAD